MLRVHADRKKSGMDPRERRLEKAFRPMAASAGPRDPRQSFATDDSLDTAT